MRLIRPSRESFTSWARKMVSMRSSASEHEMLRGGADSVIVGVGASRTFVAAVRTIARAIVRVVMSFPLQISLVVGRLT